MFRPENNSLVLDELENVAGRYPFANFLIYDRACKIHLCVKKGGEALGDIDLRAKQVLRREALTSCPANPFSPASLTSEYIA